jgi:hypothetical protein
MDIVYDFDHTMPCELVCKILTLVIADSVHTVCCSDVYPPWEMNVASVLSSVSFAFQEIVKELVIKAFEIPQLTEDTR